MNIAYLLTGSNMTNKKEQLSAAISYLQQRCGVITAQSAIYETAAWGNTKQAAFLNQALELRTALAPSQLLRSILAIEKKMGRIRSEKYGPRIIDIDILFFNQKIITRPLLSIPHPEMQHRRFVLQPLTEIAGEILHPVFHITVNELLQRCKDTLTVKRSR